MAQVGVICRCLNPRKICNPYTGQSMIVPCGHCKSCQLNKNNHMAFLCDLEAQSHKYCMFITLTYAQRYIPRAQLVDSLVRPFSYDLVSDDGEILSSVDMSEEEKELFLQKFHVFGSVPYLRRDDLQLFLKRFRYYASKITKGKVRYFACGEYGPAHFRPHFHLLLFFDDDTLLQACESLVLQAWRYGRVDVQLSKGQCSSYVAGYVNSSMSLPKVFVSRSVRPFCLHSQRMGQRILQGQRSAAYSLTPDDFIRKCIVVNGNFKEFQLWRSAYSYFFPKCRGFFDKSSSELYFTYTLYRIAKRCFPTCETVIDLARMIAATVYYFGVDPETFGTDTETYRLARYFDDHHDIVNLSTPEGDRYVHRIYCELLISKHFLTFVCDHITEFEIKRKINLIREFYSRLDYLHLLDFFENQRFFFDSDLLGGDDLLSDQDNVYYPYIYDNVNFSWQDYYSAPAFRIMNEKVSSMYRDRIKHKFLNDKNGIFLQEDDNNV